MKKFSHILGLTLVASALFVSACSKKPKHGTDDATQMGTTINPDAQAVAPDTTLTNRDANAGDIEGKSVVEPVYFQLDRSAVPQAERVKIEAAVKWLKDNPEKNLVLEGHCDWRGTPEYNLGLGDRRSAAVRKYLESLGIDTKRLETLSKGSTDAKKDGGEEVWSKDRRVDFLPLKHP